MNDDPIQLFLDALSDNAAVSLAFIGSLFAWFQLRGQENAIARAAAGAMLPIAAGVLPYILVMLWLAFVPIDGTMLLEGDHWALRILGAAEQIHGTLEWGVWALPVTLLALLVTIRSSQTLARFNWMRRWQGLAVATTSIFLAFTPLGVRTGFWDDRASASLKIELKPAIETAVKTLAIAKIRQAGSLDRTAAVTAMDARGAALRQEIEAVGKSECVGENCRLHPAARQLALILDGTAEDFGNAYGKELAAAAAAAVPSEDDADDPRREAAAATLADQTTAVLIPGDGIGALVLNAIVGGYAEEMAGRLLAHLPLKRLVALRTDPSDRLALVRPAVDRLQPQAIVPDPAHVAAFAAKLEPVEHQIKDPAARPPLFRDKELDPDRRPLEEREIEHAPIRVIR